MLSQAVLRQCCLLRFIGFFNESGLHLPPEFAMMKLQHESNWFHTKAVRFTYGKNACLDSLTFCVMLDLCCSKGAVRFSRGFGCALFSGGEQDHQRHRRDPLQPEQDLHPQRNSAIPLRRDGQAQVHD